MADQNDPWAAFNPQHTPAASPFGARPVIMEPAPEPKTPTPQNPEQRTSTVTSTQQTEQQIRFNRAKTGADLGESFRNDKAVAAYREVLPQVAQAENARPGGEGDLTVIYAWAKAMDPAGSVREGDTGLAKSVSPIAQRAELLAQQVRSGNFLPPSIRLGLIEEMRNKSGQLNKQYSAVRDHYVQLATANGVDPSVIGDHEGQMYRADEEQYIQAHGGVPRDPARPEPEAAPPAPTVTEKGFGIAPDSKTPTQSGEDFRNQLYAAMKAKQIKSPADIKAFEQQYNQSHGTRWSIDFQNPDTRRAIGAALSGKAFNIETPIPDISDAPEGVGPSLVRGAADTATSGLRDKIVAAGDALQNNSPFDYNLARQYAISDRDQQDHPAARFSGQILGGVALPMGEMQSAGQIVGKSAIAGAAYGAGSSRSPDQIIGNALMGGVAGAAGGEFLGAGYGGRALAGRNALLGPRAQQVVPPLVDTVSGELNQPMDAMRPAQRMAVMDEFGLKTRTPGMAGGRSAQITEQSLNNLPGSAGHMEDINAAASQELSRARTDVAQKFGSSRTMNEGGAELQRGANERIERGKLAIGKAYAAIPIADTAPAAKTNTVNTLQSLTGRFQSNSKLAGAMHDPQLAKYLEAFESGDISWKDLKEFRTAIGEKVGEMRFGESSSKSDLRALYAGLSEDMRATAAQMGPRASRAFDRANSLNRQNEEMIQKSLTRILGKDGNMSPEKAAAAVKAMTQAGKTTGDLRALAQIRAATIKSGAWDEIASTLIHLSGQPANSEGRAFSPETFVRSYADMSEPARAMLFKPELRGALDRFVALNQQLSRVKGLKNSSNSAPIAIGAGGLGAAGVALFTQPWLALGIAGGAVANYGMGKLWTNPKFVNLITGYARASRSGSKQGMSDVSRGFAKLVTTNPELREPLVQLQKQLASHANDNATRAAAASSADADENQK